MSLIQQALSKKALSGVAIATLLLLGSAFNVSSAYSLGGPRYSGVSERDLEKKQQAEEIKAQEEVKISDIEKTAKEKEAEEIKALLAANKNPMLLYGDQKLTRFLGCLNCTPDYYISIWNTESPFGSPTGHISIWNSTTEYGSIVSKISPWNKYSSNPPAIIDPAGKLYGFLTANTSIDNRFMNNFAEHLYYSHDSIRLDPNKWFKRFFAIESIKKVGTISLEELEAMPKPVTEEDMLEPAPQQPTRADGISGHDVKSLFN